MPVKGAGRTSNRVNAQNTKVQRKGEAKQEVAPKEAVADPMESAMSNQTLRAIMIEARSLRQRMFESLGDIAPGDDRLKVIRKIRG